MSNVNRFEINVDCCEDSRDCDSGDFRLPLINVVEALKSAGFDVTEAEKITVVGPRSQRTYLIEETGGGYTSHLVELVAEDGSPAERDAPSREELMEAAKQIAIQVRKAEEEAIEEDEYDDTGLEDH